MTLVQTYLLSHSLSELKTEHGIDFRPFNHKVSLNYNQIEARDDDPIAQECRGLVLAPVGPMTTDSVFGASIVLARPFNRFFNMEQGAAAKVDFNDSDLRFYEKLDGTMTILYFDSIVNQWHVATRSVSEANLPVDGFAEYTFRTLFERACVETTGIDFDQFVSHLDKTITYLFELTTPLNRIVVKYDTYRITLLGARETVTGREIDPVVLAPTMPNGIVHAPNYRLGSIPDMVTFVTSRNPEEHEGIVVCDSNFRRVKVKNPAYLALTRIRDSVVASPRSLLELILLEKFDDAVSILPEHIVKLGNNLRTGLVMMNKDIEVQWNTCKNIADNLASINDSPKEHRKQFAIAINQTASWMPPLMDRYTGHSDSMIAWVMNNRTNNGTWSASFLTALYSRIVEMMIVEHEEEEVVID
jgi:hypothetical protein